MYYISKKLQANISTYEKTQKHICMNVYTYENKQIHARNHIDLNKDSNECKYPKPIY